MREPARAVRPARRLLALCSSVSWGGTEKWLLRSCEHLAARGWDVTIAVRNESLFRSRAEVPLPLRRLPFRNDADIETILSLAGFARRRADVILVTRVRDYTLGGLAGRLARRPVVLRLGVVRPMREDYWNDLFRYRILPSAILVNAHRIEQTLRKTRWMRSKPIHVVYNGVTARGPMVPARRAELRASVGLRDRDVLLVGAGRLAVEKRWDWFVRAAAPLIAEGLDVHAHLLGDGSERAALRAEIERVGSAARFHLDGYRADAEDWIAAADAVVLPSRNEGVPNVVLEALGARVAVVATRAGGLGEILTHGRHALLADVDDEAGFARLLREIVMDPSRRESIAEQGYWLVAERFTWDAMAGALEEMFDQVVAKRGRGRRTGRARG